MNYDFLLVRVIFAYVPTFVAQRKYDFFCLIGAFLENSLSKQNFPSPNMLAVCMQGEGESLLAALRMVFCSF